MVEIAIGDENAGNRRIARTARMQAAKALYLRADLRRRIEEKPAFPVGADRN